MKFVTSAMVVKGEELEQFKPLDRGSIMRVRLVQPSDEVQPAGDLAIPIFIVNGEKKLDRALDAEDPVEIVIRTDLPPTGFYSIPVYVVGEEQPETDESLVKYGGSIQIQSGETSEA